MRLALDPKEMATYGTFGIHDDFHWYISPHLWTTTATDSGTVAVGDAAGGVVTLTASDGSVADNDEVYMLSTKELFLFASDKPITFQVRLQFTEENTDDANICVGLMNAVAANSILDDGGGPAASYSGMVVFKVDGGTVWQCESSLAGTQTTTVSSHTAGGSSYHTIRMEFKTVSSTVGEVAFFIDTAGGNNWKQMTDANNKLIKHNVTYTSATEMMAFVGVKNGGANNQTCLVDRIDCWQKR